MTNNGNDENISADNDGTIKYDEEVYDHALFEAIAKSYNYLKPFYAYDLDTIYSVEWDSAKNGGSDSDVTTLSIDFDDGDEHSAISAYLPYGTYVIVEQQPARRDGSVNDWENRSYSIEKPKEVLVPSLYDAGESDDTTDNYNAHYSYDETMPTEEQAKEANYMISFGEEWSDETANAGQDERHYVIRAHNYYGDYEIYKYGLDIDPVSYTHLSTTMLSLLSSAFAVDTDETDDNNAYMLAPYIREDYGFAKTGFSAFKEKILDAVKFLTGSFATPSNATDSEAEEDEADNITVPDLDLFGKAENVGTAIKDGVSDLLTIKAYAAEVTSAETEEIASAETETETAEGTEAETKSKEAEKEKQTEASVSSKTTVAVEDVYKRQAWMNPRVC